MIRSAAAGRDDLDPLARFRDQFVIEDDLLYLDGNSLGRLPKRTIAVMAETIEQEWGVGLVTSWPHRWIDLPTRIGDRLATVIGARPGEVLLADQTSVNLYKMAGAGLTHSGRTDIVSDGRNFPSGLYILDGLARARGGRLRVVRAGAGDRATVVADAIDHRVGLLALSHVDYRSGELYDMEELSAIARAAGALALWDISHSVGVVPIDLSAAGVDLAVGCTYKYLNGGPGAPGFLFAGEHLRDRLTQPIQGWFGHADQFAFEAGYRPADGIRRFSVGTPPIVSLRGAEVGIALAAEAGVGAARAKSLELTGLLIELYDAALRDLGFELLSPRVPSSRGGHVGLAHPSAWQIAQALVDRGVVADFRAPDVIRLGPAPLYTRFVDVWAAMEVLADVAASEKHLNYPQPSDSVT